MNVKKFLRGTKDFLMDTTIEAIERHFDEEIVQAVEQQKSDDVYAATCAFIKLKQNDGAIYELLNDYFDVRDVSEAREYVKKARVYTQIVNLRGYCNEQGMTLSEFRQYAKEYKLEEKLKSNSKLLDMPVEKLKATIEKK